MSLKDRLIRLERNGRPVNQIQRQRIQHETLAAMPEDQRRDFESLVDGYLALDPRTRSSEAVWNGLLDRPKTEWVALLELNDRCKAREAQMGIAR